MNFLADIYHIVKKLSNPRIAVAEKTVFWTCAGRLILYADGWLIATRLAFKLVSPVSALSLTLPSACHFSYLTFP
jgi:hypothetical protein